MGWLRSKKLIAIFAVIIVCGAGTAAFFAFKPAGKKAAETQQQRVVRVTRGEIKFTVSGTSQFEPKDVQNIIAPADGTIKTMNLSRNQEVKKGDLLFEISDPSRDAALQQAQTTLQQMEKDLADLEEQQNHMTIVASASGILTLNGGLDAGSNVSKNGKIGTIAEDGELTLKLPFPAAEAVQAAKGDPVDLSVNGYMLTKTGTVESVEKNLTADANGNKLLNVVVNVPNDGTLAAGMKVKGSLSVGGRKVDSASEGTLDYKNIVTLLSEAQGTVKQLNVKSGSVVHKGDVIAILTNDTLADNILTKQTDIERQKILVTDAQDKVNELKVTAPFDGVFSTDFANKRTNVLNSYPVGAKITAGTQLGAVASLDSMQLPVQVDELDLPSIKLGQKANVTVDALPGKVFEGEVSQVSSVGTTTNGVTSYDVVVTVKNTDQSIKNGMTATAEILVQDKKNILVLPVEALQQQRGQRFVSLQKADGTVEKQHPVKIGLRSQTQVEITDGLQEGDQVLVPVAPQRGSLTQDQQNQLRRQFQGGAGGAGGFGGGGFGGNFVGGGGGGGGGNGRTGGNNRND
jgi:HlyD family secretion protein